MAARAAADRKDSPPEFDDPFDPRRDIVRDEHIRGVRPEFEATLRRLVEIPTVSSDPDRKADIARGARAAAELIEWGGGRARIVSTMGNPVVVGEFVANQRAPWLTIYNHLDVQPADREKEGWTHEPFTFVIDGDRYLGRGSTDDKGPALTAFFAARRAQQEGIQLNIRFLWEMEEEIGSPNFETFLKSEKMAMPSQSILVSDTVWVSRDRPALSYGLRGLLGMLFRLRTGTKDVHSGLTGGAARNPFVELSEVIAKCIDGKTGKIRIPDIYDDVRPLLKPELDNFLASGFKVAQFQKDHGLKSLRSRDNATVLKSIWTQPTFEVHGWGGGYTGPGIKTIVPPFAEAKISMRLVPDQDPKKILKLVRDFVRSVNPDVEVVHLDTLEPFLGEPTGPFAEAAKTSLRRAVGKTPVFVREGGSIGAVLTMQRHLKAPILFMGLSLPEHGYHAPNEHYDWGQASRGMKAFLNYFDHLAAMPR